MAKLGGIRFLSVPGVYFPGNDTHLLAEALAAERPRPETNVLDICTGSGYLAVAAARLGAGAITAVDVSRRALASTRLNAMLNHVSVHVRHSDLFSALGDEATFDLIVSNPPWVPSVTDELPQSGMARAWNAGQDGRALIDPICAQAPGHLGPAGVLLLLQPMVGDTSATMRALTAQGLNVTMAARLVAPMTPLLRERARQLHERCPWGPDDSTYEIGVIRAARPAVPSTVTWHASRASSAK